MLRLAKLKKQPITLFQKPFDVKQKSNERLTVKQFHKFYNEFTNKFQIVHDFLSTLVSIFFKLKSDKTSD